MEYPHRVQLWEWKTGKVIPKPKTLKKLPDEQLREELALLAIKKYLPFIKSKKIKKELLNE
jgi:hypothetical protein